jgi:hypothetical protein
MRAGLTRRHLLKGLIAGGLCAVPPLAPGTAATHAGPVSAEPPPAASALCTCPRVRTYSVYCGNAPIVETTLTYRCPRCGKQVVEHGWRLAEPYYRYSTTAPDPGPEGGPAV